MASIFDRNISFFGYQVNALHVLSTVSITATLSYALNRLWKYLPSKYQALSDRDFWDTVSHTPTISRDAEPFSVDAILLLNLPKRHHEMALSCNKVSGFVSKYLINSDFKGTVLDLGSGTGSNALPLVAKGCQVTIIDQFEDVISIYKQHEMNLFNFSGQDCNHLQKATSLIGDMTTIPFPKDVDAIICVDALPYILPSAMQQTLKKIYQALRPGGQFIGTLFFKPYEREDSVTTDMRKIGAHFYLGEALARDIVLRSGFTIQHEKKRKDDGFFSKSHCLEFLAAKPV